MRAQIKSYFSFLLYPDDPNFLPIYWVASFLCPFYRFIITSEEMPVQCQWPGHTLKVSFIL